MLSHRHAAQYASLLRPTRAIFERTMADPDIGYRCWNSDILHSFYLPGYLSRIVCLWYSNDFIFYCCFIGVVFGIVLQYKNLVKMRQEFSAAFGANTDTD
jgi:hypothetical protein